MAKKSTATVVAEFANKKEQTQITNVLMFYTEREKDGVDQKLLVPIITYKSVPEQFDIRHVRFTRNNSNDFEIFNHLKQDIKKITDSDFDLLLEGKKVSRGNYGFLPEDSSRLSADLSASAIEKTALERENEALKNKLKALEAKTPKTGE